MIALLAGLGAKIAANAMLGKVAANAKRDAIAAGGWLSRRKPIELLAMALAIAVVVQYFVGHRHAAKLEKQLGKCATALTDTRSAFDRTVANYRAAAATARAADAANKVRVEGEQKAISERTDHDYQVRIASARALADRLRRSAAAADQGGSRAASVPGISPAASGASQPASEDRLPDSDKLTATEQAIQLDELIKWVVAQHAVDPNGQPGREGR